MYVYMFPPKGPEVICNAVKREREKGAGLPAYVAALCIMHYTVCIIYHVCAQLSIQQPFFGSFYWIVPIFPGCSTVVTLLHESFTESTFFLSQIFLLVAKQGSFLTQL